MANRWADTLIIAADGTLRPIISTIDCNAFVVNNIDGADDIKFYWEDTDVNFFLVKMGWQYSHDVKVQKGQAIRWPPDKVIGWIKTSGASYNVVVVLATGS